MQFLKKNIFSYVKFEIVCYVILPKMWIKYILNENMSNFMFCEDINYEDIILCEWIC